MQIRKLFMISLERQITALSLTSLCTLAFPRHTTYLPNQIITHYTLLGTARLRTKAQIRGNCKQRNFFILICCKQQQLPLRRLSTYIICGISLQHIPRIIIAILRTKKFTVPLFLWFCTVYMNAREGKELKNI